MIDFKKAGDAIVVEPRTVMQEYAARWGRARIDRGELARLRFVEKWPIKRIEVYFGVGRTKIKKETRRLRVEFREGTR